MKLDMTEVWVRVLFGQYLVESLSGKGNTLTTKITIKDNNTMSLDPEDNELLKLDNLKLGIYFPNLSYENKRVIEPDFDNLIITWESPECAIDILNDEVTLEVWDGTRYIDEVKQVTPELRNRLKKHFDYVDDISIVYEVGQMFG